MSFYPARTARQARAHHRAAAPGGASARTIDGPLTTVEALRRAAGVDTGWACAWALAAIRGQGEVPSAPLEPGAAERLLPGEVLTHIAGHVNARSHQRREYHATGFGPPEVPASSRNSWHAWLGGAAVAASTMPDTDATPPVEVPGLTRVVDAPLPPPPATARVFPPLFPDPAAPAAARRGVVGGALRPRPGPHR